MHSKRESMEEFRRLLERGSIQKAYRELLSFMAGLRTHFERRAGGGAVSGLYQGRLDMTYFALFPPSLRRRNLKIAILFNYDAFRFEAWLAGRNREVQRKYWELIKDAPWPGCRVVSPAKGVDSILECDLASDFDLGKPEALSAAIEKAALAFIARIEEFLSEGEPAERRKPRRRTSGLTARSAP